MTNKKILIIVSLLLVSLLLVGCWLFPQNKAPEITSIPVTEAEIGVLYTYDVDATDPDVGDVLTYSLTTEPSGMLIDGTSGVITWTPTAAGDFPVTVEVSDGKLSDTQSFIVTIGPAEPEPEIELTGIVVAPKTMTLFAGKSETIKSVTATYEIRGTEVPIALEKCTFTSSATGIATVSGTGVVTAVAGGTATITVTYKGKTDTIAITVNPKTYIIAASASTGGSISPSGDVTVSEGSDKVFTITSSIFYSLTDVLVDGSSVGTVNSYTFINVTKDHTIHATFNLFGRIYNQDKEQYYDTIQKAIDDADDDNTILVSAGTYPEVVTVNESVTLQGEDMPEVTAFHITSDDVTVTGFKIVTTWVLGEKASIYLAPTLSNVIISYNNMEGQGSGRGILLGLYGGGADYSNVYIGDNKIHNLVTGIYTNPHTGIIVIEDNEIWNAVAGIGGATGASIKYNTFHNCDEAVGVDNSLVNLTLEYNNLLSPVINWGSVELDATKNWWGHASGPYHPTTNPDGIGNAVSNNVTYNPWLTSPYLH